jgi:Sec-independent protein translocase protein TatA
MMIVQKGIYMVISEIIVILVVALLVIKPERIPETVYTLGRGLKKLRAIVTTIQQEIEKPLERFNSDHERK